MDIVSASMTYSIPSLSLSSFYDHYLLRIYFSLLLFDPTSGIIQIQLTLVELCSRYHAASYTELNN